MIFVVVQEDPAGFPSGEGAERPLSALMIFISLVVWCSNTIQNTPLDATLGCMTNTHSPEFLTVSEAADRAGCHRQTIHRWFREELLTRYEVKGRPRVKASELDELLTPKPVSA